MKQSIISPTFLINACDLLANTETGISGSDVVKICMTYAAQSNIDIPHCRYPFEAANKRTALFENLQKFDSKTQFKILLEIINSEKASRIPEEKLRNIKIGLLSKYSYLGSMNTSELETYELVEDTKHWLSIYPEILKLYNEAFSKYKSQIFNRNILDDMRLSLELLIQKICGNKKSLENQQSTLGTFIKEKGSSPEFNNMLLKLIDYYCKYQDTYVKHDDSVPENEVEFIIEMTSSFIKHLVKLINKEKS